MFLSVADMLDLDERTRVIAGIKPGRARRQVQSAVPFNK